VGALLAALLLAGSWETGAVHVAITWEGERPKPRAVQFPADWMARNPADAEHCQRCAGEGPFLDDALLVDEATGGVAAVAVAVQGLEPPAGAPPAPAALLDNRGCRFVPRVQFAPVGRPLLVLNSDPMPHNARITSRGGREIWNGLLAAQSRSETRPLPASGIHSVACDLHPWMRATVIAVRHPWHAVTDVGGTARIEGLPAGVQARLVLWHEILGTAAVEFEVPRGGTHEVRLGSSAFTRPDSAPPVR
jgi:hypothetical protein